VSDRAPLGTISEPAREVDVVHETGVLVVGSGPAGLAAAVAAARAGVDVTLVERFGCYGGNITAVGVEGMAWYRHEETVEANGIGREFETRAFEMGAAAPESQSLSYELDSEGFKVVADRIVEEAGVHGMLHRLFVAPIMDGHRVTGIVTESKAGREAIRARRVIDATGDADVADRAGAPTHKTPREEMMAASVMFHLAGVDKRAFLEGVRADPQTYRDWGGGGEWNIETSGKEDDMFSPFIMHPFQKAIADGLIPPHLTTIAGTWGAVHDSGELTYMNLVHLDGIDGTDPDDLTRGEIEGRRQAMLAIEALRRYMPGCETARLRNFGMTLGVRDTRKIDARYNMTEDDVRNEARFDDSIGIYPEFIDGYGILVLPTTGRYFQLPARNVVPKDVRNLLVAGRSSGGDRISHAATRNMSCCAVLGQGAGIMAALSLHQGCEVDDIDIAAVQKELDRQGVRYR
jgi:ribulose 1,5-bisphosphate synthetase/thiazole synthase